MPLSCSSLRIRFASADDDAASEACRPPSLQIDPTKHMAFGTRSVLAHRSCSRPITRHDTWKPTLMPSKALQQVMA